jgi:murein DD-endopeptidase MepM/ murein hydrolase activator NlpD
MNSHFTVTITDEKGVKQYSVHKFVKRAVIYVAFFLTLLAFIAVATIFYLNKTIKESEAKKEQIQKAYVELAEKNLKLNENIKKNEEIILEKKLELQEVSNTLEEIQRLIGLKPSLELSLKERVDLTKLTSENIATILQFIPNGSPIEYNGITSKFGWRIHPTLNKREFHTGSDLKAKMKTPVYATADGVVEYAGYHKKSGFGYLLIIDNNYGFKTYFAHLNKIKVKAGQFVKKGDLIALSGNSGLSNGPHLHYEIRFLQRPLNPYWFIKWGVDNFYEIFEKEKKVPWQSLIVMMQDIKIKKQAKAQQLSLQAHQSKEK